MLTLEPVDGDNWRDVAKLEVTPEQQEFVAAPTYYLCLCHYSPAGWRPLAVRIRPSGTYGAASTDDWTRRTAPRVRSSASSCG